MEETSEGYRHKDRYKDLQQSKWRKQVRGYRHKDRHKDLEPSKQRKQVRGYTHKDRHKDLQQSKWRKQVRVIDIKIDIKIYNKVNGGNK